MTITTPDDTSTVKTPAPKPASSESLDSLKDALRAFIKTSEQFRKTLDKMPPGALRRSLR